MSQNSDPGAPENTSGNTGQAAPATPPGQSSDQTAKPDASTGSPDLPDWVKDPSGFDPARAHKTIVQLREELKTFRDAARKEREAKMSQEERLAAERDEHKTARTAAEKQLWALQAAVKQGLDPADAEYLTGNTEQELQAAAERFAQRHGPARQPAGSGLLGRLAAGVPNQQPPFGGNQFDPEKIAERTLRNR